MSVVAWVPGLRIKSVLNLREHWAVRRKRVADERLAVAAALARYTRPATDGPIRVTFTRCGGRQLDDDNLASGFKGARDEVAKWLRRGDDPKAGVEWVYRQTNAARADGVKIEIDEL